MKKYDFIAIDFETADGTRYSPCAVGIVAVSHMEIVERFHTLINPKCEFFERCVAIHGIHKEDVADAPDFMQVWDIIRPYLSDCGMVVGHNSKGVEMHILENCFPVDIEDLRFADTMNLTAPFIGSRKSLEVCADYFGLPVSAHHDPLNDAEVCAKIAIELIRACGKESISEIVRKSMKNRQTILQESMLLTGDGYRKTSKKATMQS